MATRLRERRRGGRTPGILRPNTGQTVERPVGHGARVQGANWRMFSGLIVVALLFVLAMFFIAPIFYIHSIAVGGLRYTTKEEVFALTGIANMHIFWVDAEEVRRNVLRSPTIADVRVTVGWPPQMVQVIVEEREPALIWEQAGVSTWLDVQGRVMQLREDRPNLLRIQSNVDDGPVGPNVQLPLDIVTGALQLKSLRPNIETLRYDPTFGLGYQDGRGWEAWFGTGTDMPEKLKIYETLVENLLARSITPTRVDVGNPDAPYYCCRG